MSFNAASISAITITDFLEGTFDIFLSIVRMLMEAFTEFMRFFFVEVSMLNVTDLYAIGY